MYSLNNKLLKRKTLLTRTIELNIGSFREACVLLLKEENNGL